MRINAALCYLRKNGKTLMMHRVKKANDIHHGKWNGLGGKMEMSETPEECVIREMKEESGFCIKNPDLRGIMTFPKFDGKNDWIVFLFVAHQFKGKQIECNEGDLEWVPNHKLTKLPLWEGDKLFLKWLEQKKFFSAKFVYERGKLKKHQVHFYPANG